MSEVDEAAATDLASEDEEAVVPAQRVECLNSNDELMEEEDENNESPSKELKSHSVRPENSTYWPVAMNAYTEVLCAAYELYRFPRCPLLIRCSGFDKFGWPLSLPHVCR